MQPELQPIRTGNTTASQDYAAQQHRVLRNTYWLLALSLVPTIIGAAIGTNLNLGFMRQSPILSFFVILAVFYGWIFAIERNKPETFGHPFWSLISDYRMLLLAFSFRLAPHLQRAGLR